MKNIARIILTIITISALSGCQAGRVVHGKTKASKERRPVFGAPQTVRSDTSVVRLPDIKSNSAQAAAPTEVEKEFESAIAIFDSGDYEAACSKFKIFAETLAKEDSLRQEAAFMLGECAAAEGKAAEAMDLFESLFSESDVIGSVQEKLLVRIGQLYCYMGIEARARKFFDRLKSEYPRSIYIQVANCDAIK